MSTNSDEYNFQKLTPIMDADISGYKEALDFVFDENSGLKNIAITGSYSAGKSSVIETYKKTIEVNEKYRFLHISLAHFEKNSTEENIDENEDVIKNSDLEGKIINQLIHQIPPSKIPQTQFKVKRKLGDLELWLRTIAISVFVCLLIFLFNNDNWDKHIESLKIKWLKTILNFTTGEVFSFIALVLTLTIATYFIYYVIKIQYNRNMFKKLTLQGNEIEILADQEDSYFDKYLNEVLYLFRNSDHQIFVFEDMDRFNDNMIFEKLREINILLNKNSKQSFWFVYLLKDDMFNSKDRTKFFDFLLPIVPVVDGSNSYNQFLSLFEKGKILDSFNSNFLQGISLYIDDMRLIKNIYNEYVIYQKRIQSIELNSDKLLAIITYKNIFPRDFSELQLNRGFVYVLLMNKKIFVEKEILLLKDKIQILQQKINLSQNELTNNIYELDAIYLNAEWISINGMFENQFSSRRDFIKAINESSDILFRDDYHRNRTKIKLEDLYRNLANNEEYKNRREVLENKKEEIIEQLENEIKFLENEIQIFSEKKLKEIINKSNIDEIFSVVFENNIGEEENFNEVKSSPYFVLIKYLIRNGFIDETYSDYMTYFYENNLSRTDKVFLRSITDEVGKEFNYELKNIVLIMERLESKDFKKEETLNFDLFEHLLKNESEYLQTLINQLKQNKRLDFIREYLVSEHQDRYFFKKVNQAWPSLWKEISEGSVFSSKEIRDYARNSLYFSTNEDIEAMNEEEILTSYISKDKLFLEIDSPQIELLVQKFDLLNVKFSEVEYESANPFLFTEVYKNDQYELNENMILTILRNIYKEQDNDDLKHKNFTIIASKTDESLFGYVMNNMEIYIEVVLNSCDGKIADSEAAALQIINHSQVSDEQKELYLSYLETVLVDINSVDDKTLWPTLIKTMTIKSSLNNILDFYFLFSEDFTEELTLFVNQSSYELKLDYDDISSKYGESETDKFYELVVVNNELSNDKYEEIFKNYNYEFEEFRFEEIEDSKVDILINLSVIFMNEKNLDFIRENYPHSIQLFIKNNIEKYVNEVISEDNFNFVEVLSVLDESIEEDYKISILEYTNNPITLRGKEYSEKLQLYILNNNLDDDDIAFLTQQYELRTPEFKDAIIEVCINNIGSIADIITHNSLPFELILKLFESHRIESKMSKQILNEALSYLEVKQAKLCFETLNMGDFLRLLKGGRPRIEKNEENENILKAMKTRDWVTSYKISADDGNYFIANGKRKIEDN